jgi:hypothetical protein
MPPQRGAALAADARRLPASSRLRGRRRAPPAARGPPAAAPLAVREASPGLLASRVGRPNRKLAAGRCNFTRNRSNRLQNILQNILQHSQHPPNTIY